MSSYSVSDLFERYPELKVSEASILEAFRLLKKLYSNNGTLFTCGNGGSAADAEHMVGELMKGFLLPRHVPSDIKLKLMEEYGELGGGLSDNLQGGLPAISLNGHPSLSSAYGNDVDFEMIFAQQLYVLGKRGDVLIGFTTSGNSKNVMNAFRIAGIIGIKTIAFTGSAGGISADIVDCCIKVPERETYKIQELHLPVYHALCAMLEEEFYGE